jgi:hypothetical protein
LNRNSSAIGFDRKVRLGWLDATAVWVAQGMSAAEIRSKLDLLLEGEVTGEAARKKTKGVLLRTWLLVPDHLCALRDEGISILAERLDIDRLTLHWGMICTNYPIVWETASTVGRLLNLQGTVSVAQVKRRSIEGYGERSTLTRASQRILRSFADWGVLRETPEKGVYTAGPAHPIEEVQIAAWLVEAALLASGSQLGVLPTLLNSPALFPFSIAYSDTRFLENSPRLELYRQGRDEDLVALQGRRL